MPLELHHLGLHLHHPAPRTILFRTFPCSQIIAKLILQKLSSVTIKTFEFSFHALTGFWQCTEAAQDFLDFDIFRVVFVEAAPLNKVNVFHVCCHWG
jgi:hypothetical protein